MSDFNVDAALTLAKDSADILLAPEGNLVQNILVEESATIVNANMKDTLREIFVENPERIRSSLPLGIGNLLPKGPVEEIEKFLHKSEREQQVQGLAKKIPEPPSPAELSKLVRSIGGSTAEISAVEGMSTEQIAILWKSLRENIPVYGPRVARLGGKFASMLLLKVSDNIEQVNINSKDTNQGIPEQAIRSFSEGVSAAAKRSSDALSVSNAE